MRPAARAVRHATRRVRAAGIEERLSTHSAASTTSVGSRRQLDAPSSGAAGRGHRKGEAGDEPFGAHHPALTHSGLLVGRDGRENLDSLNARLRLEPDDVDALAEKGQILMNMARASNPPHTTQ